MNLPKSWGEWLTNNADVEALDKNTNFVMTAAQQAKDKEKIIELLLENNDIVTMTKSAIGNHLQFSFQHMHHGSSLLAQQKSLTAITSFEDDTPIEIDTKHLHKATNKTDSPSFGAILNTADPTQLSTLTRTHTHAHALTRTHTHSQLLQITKLNSRVQYYSHLSSCLAPENVYRILTSRILQREENLFTEFKDNYKITNSIVDNAEEILPAPSRRSPS